MNHRFQGTIIDDRASLLVPHSPHPIRTDVKRLLSNGYLHCAFCNRTHTKCLVICFQNFKASSAETQNAEAGVGDLYAVGAGCDVV